VTGDLRFLLQNGPKNTNIGGIAMGVWDDLLRRVKFTTREGDFKRPEVEDLDRFESEFGSKLPDDYREFALTFGPGELGIREWCFRTPGFAESGRSFDLAEANGGIDNRGLPNASDVALARRGDPTLIRRLVLFCSGGFDGDYFCWDPTEVTNPEKHEYAIYITCDALDPMTQRASSGFHEFVLDYLLGGGYERHIYEPGTEPGEPPGKEVVYFQDRMPDPGE
jgi:hypothetical protein